MKCEYCDKEHDGSYGTGRFCSESCKQTFISKNGWSQNPDRKGSFSDKEIWNKSQATRDRKIQDRYDSTPFEKLPKHEIKRRLTRKQFGACLICGLTDWQDKPITLELDHINGDNSDDKEDNVRLLCPNCHSQTDTFVGKNVNKINKEIEDSVLLDLLKSTPTVRQALIKAGLTPKAGNYNRCYNLMIENGIRI